MWTDAARHISLKQKLRKSGGKSSKTGFIGRERTELLGVGTTHGSKQEKKEKKKKRKKERRAHSTGVKLFLKIDGILKFQWKQETGRCISITTLEKTFESLSPPQSLARTRELHAKGDTHSRRNTAFPYTQQPIFTIFLDILPIFLHLFAFIPLILSFSNSIHITPIITRHMIHVPTQII